MSFIKDNTNYGKESGVVVDLPILAATDIDQSDLIGIQISTGYARVFQDGDKFMGVARESVDNTDGGSGDAYVQVEIQLQELTGVTVEGTGSAGALSAIDLGKDVYFVSNGSGTTPPTFTVVADDADGGNFMGTLTKLDSVGGTTGSVLLKAAGGNNLAAMSKWTREIPLSNTAMELLLSTGTGAVTGSIPLPGAGGTIDKVSVGVTVVTASANKAFTIQPQIGSTSLTGGAVALQTSTLNAITDLTAGTAVTSDNRYESGDTMRLFVSANTAIPEVGSIVVYVEGSSRS